MTERDPMTAFQMKRRHFLLATLAMIPSTRAASAEPRRFRVAFANLNEEPGTRIDGLGFTGLEIRRSFELASRGLPVDMIYYDNGGDGDKALGNAKDAVASKVDEKVQWVKDAAGSRFADLELNVLVFFGMITGDARALAENLAGAFGVTPEEALELPYAWFGSVDEICDKLRAARDRWGISYSVMQKDGMEAMAPVVAQLTGT